MKTLFKKVTVEQIHQEFDSAQERILNEADRLLDELKIPTETKLERKAKALKELGFVNSEPVKQYSKLETTQNEIKKKLELTSTQAEAIRYFSAMYPLEKFITVSELERICAKYNLIHAPSANYIKDIPEKNVLEMKNANPLKSTDKAKDNIIPTSYRYSYLESNEASWFDKNIGLNKEIPTKHIDLLRCDSWGCEFRTPIGTLTFGSYASVNRTGLFIAAPKSHFNLKGLDKKSKFGFFTVTVHEVKDPVVFQYCRNNIVRIISKWGTDDDKSYLDSALTNENMN